MWPAPDSRAVFRPTETRSRTRSPPASHLPVEELKSWHVEGILREVERLLIRCLIDAISDLAALGEVPAELPHQLGPERDSEFLARGPQERFAEALRWRNHDPKGPHAQAPQQFEMPLNERAEATLLGVRGEVRSTVRPVGSIPIGNFSTSRRPLKPGLPMPSSSNRSGWMGASAVR